jgi:hypothetical protein
MGVKETQHGEQMKAFSDHFMATDSDLMYLGTHYGYDVYIDPKTHYLYVVYGVVNYQYYSAVGYLFTRTTCEFGNIHYGLAAACALMRHPQYIAGVLEAHP